MEGLLAVLFALIEVVLFLLFLFAHHLLYLNFLRIMQFTALSPREELRIGLGKTVTMSVIVSLAFFFTDLVYGTDDFWTLLMKLVITIAFLCLSSSGFFILVFWCLCPRLVSALHNKRFRR